MQEFPPMDLLWSHVKKPLQGISPGLQKHCDLGFIQAPGRSLEQKIDAVLTQNAMFYFDLEVKPNLPGWSIGAGTYRLDLAVAAANAAVRKLELEIEFLGQWFDSEEQMFRNGIRERQEGVRQHHQRHMMVPAIPASSFVVIQAEFFLELVVVLFDLPPAVNILPGARIE